MDKPEIDVRHKFAKTGKSSPQKDRRINYRPETAKF